MRKKFRELAHIDLTKLPKDLRAQLKIKESYVAALEDDCTRLTYVESIADKRSSTLTYFMARGLTGFKPDVWLLNRAVISDMG